jgi:hypothetical protein
MQILEDDLTTLSALGADDAASAFEASQVVTCVEQLRDGVRLLYVEAADPSQDAPVADYALAAYRACGARVRHLVRRARAGTDALHDEPFPRRFNALALPPSSSEESRERVTRIARAVIDAELSLLWLRVHVLGPDSLW